MVKTRSRNKRVTYVDESAPDEDDFEDEEEFHVVPSVPVPVSASASASSAPSPVVTRQRKRRKRGEEETVASMDMLCDDVVSNVYAFLGSTRDVYSFALCSKRMFDRLTPQIVIRSAVFQGGNAAKSIEEIVRAVERKSIFFPDTLRLLRLVNGTRCERLDECWSYNLQTGLSGRASVVCPGIGMFFCRNCSSSITTVLQHQSCRWVSTEKRVATMLGGYCHRAVNECHVEAITQNPCGPLISMLDIRQIECTFRDEGERREALQSVLEESDGLDEHAEQGGAFMEIFEMAERDLEEYHQRRYKTMEAKDRERYGRRLTKLQAMFQRLESLLADAPWKELALACSWPEDLRSWPTVGFHCRIVWQKTERLFSAPSSCSQKKLKKAADDIVSAFDLLYEKDFFSFAFLAASPDAFERGLYQYCRDNLTPAKLLRRTPWDVEAWLDKIRNDRLCEAVVDTIYSLDFKEAFARAVVSSVRVVLLGLDVEKFRGVARKMWTEKFNDTTLTMTSYDDLFRLRNHRNTCRDRYASRETSLVDFLTSPATRNWLGRGEDDDRNLGPGVEFTRQNAVDQVFTRPQCILLLQTRSFRQLLRRVERYYQRPGRYGLLPPDGEL